MGCYCYLCTAKRTLELSCSVGISHIRSCYFVVCTLKYIMPSLSTYRFCFSHIDGEGWIGGKANTCEQVTESDIQRIHFHWKEIGVLYFNLCLFVCVCVMEGSSTVKCPKIPSIPLCLRRIQQVSTTTDLCLLGSISHKSVTYASTQSKRLRKEGTWPDTLIMRKNRLEVVLVLEDSLVMQINKQTN